MDKELRVLGKASGKLIRTITIKAAHAELSLMDILIENNIPVASSCSGVGTCKKCTVFIEEAALLSCQKTIRNLFSNNNIITIVINYL